MSLDKIITINAVAAASLFLLALPTLAQSNDPGATPQDTTIDHVATVGAGPTYLRVGLSKHGNVVQFESPAGVEHIRNGAIIEGYLLISDAGFQVNGYDYGLAETGWLAPTATGTLAGGDLVIKRKTTDGKFQLTQAFKIGAANLRLVITMSVKNLTTSSITPVWLTRYADWDSNNDTTNSWMRTANSILAQSVGIGVLTTVQAVAAPLVVFQPFAHNLTVFDMTAFGSSAVNFDGQGRVAFPLETLAAKASKSVKIFYQRT